MEMVERKEPDFVKLERGEIVAGTLAKIEKITIDNKPVVRFTVLDDEDRLVCFLGTYQLCNKLRRDDIGHRIEVVYTGENSDVKRNGNAMKTYQVKVSKDRVMAQEAANNLEITDADIPF